MREIVHFIKAALASWFLSSELTRHEAWLYASDLEVDDPVRLPQGKTIHIIIEYADEPRE